MSHTDTMPTAVDQLADKFAREFAYKISSIAHYVAAQYPNVPSGTFSQLTESQKIATLTVVTHAVEHCQFVNVFDHRRAAQSALDHARRALTDERTEYRFRVVYARLIGTLALNIAATYAPDPSDDDGCHCGNPDCGAC